MQVHLITKRMKVRLFFLKTSWLVIIAGGLLGGCYYDNEETLYGITTCDSTFVSTFNTDVLPMLEKYCNGCHAGSSPSGDISLDTYSNVSNYVTNGSLMGSIRHDPGFKAMPEGRGKLSACDIKKIQSWIDAGAANN